MPPIRPGRIAVVNGQRRRIYNRLDLLRLLAEAEDYRLEQRMYDGWTEGFHGALRWIGRRLGFSPGNWKQEEQDEARRD